MARDTHPFYLIKSLNKSEKRYFKRFCLIQKANNNCIQLFDAYEKQEVLDEGAIKEKFKGETFINQIHVTKSYLKQLLLKALRNYYTEQSIQTKINQLLHNVDILYQKGLYAFATAELKKTEQLAKKYECFESLVSIVGWKKKLHLIQQTANSSELLALVNEEKEAIDNLSRLNAYLEMNCTFWQYHDQPADNFFNQEPISSHAEHASLQEIILHEHLLHSYYTITNSPDLAVKHLCLLIEKLENVPDRLKENPKPYITALNNLIGARIRAGNYEEALKLLGKMRSVPELYQLKADQLFPPKVKLRMLNVELEIYRDNQNWEQGIALIKEIEKYLKQKVSHVPESYRILFPFQFAYIYFMAKDYSMALKWINELLNLSQVGERLDIQTYGRLLNLMIHFEMGNMMVLKYAVANGRRFMKKQKEIQPFENTLFRFFSKISNAPIEEYKFYFKQLDEELFATDPPLVNANILDYLDFKTWIATWTNK